MSWVRKSSHQILVVDKLRSHEGPLWTLGERVRAIEDSFHSISKGVFQEILLSLDSSCSRCKISVLYRVWILGHRGFYCLVSSLLMMALLKNCSEGSGYWEYSWKLRDWDLIRTTLNPLLISYFSWACVWQIHSIHIALRSGSGLQRLKCSYS